MPLALSEADVREVLPIADVIAAMRGALSAYSSGAAQQPLRTVIEVGDARSFFGSMPAALVAPAALGTKLVTVVSANRQRGLPTHLATIVLLDPETGALLALLDGRYITEVRTAAVSAVSVDALARQDASVLAIIGSGVQARSHLRALAAVRRLTDVRVWSPTEANRRAFVDEMRADVPAAIIATANARDAVAGADIVVLATSSRTPVVESEWIADGTHVCAVGAWRPDQREMDAALVARARVFVDSRAGASSEAGDVVLALAEGAIGPDHVAGELGDVLNGRVAGRCGAADVTLFKSLGMAVEDVAAAHLAFQRAAARGLGRTIEL